MASNNFCVYCAKLQSTLKEKESEIQKLELHIQNLSNFLLSKDILIDPTLHAKYIGDINENAANELKFYLSDLFFVSREHLNNHVLVESKSVQTDENENLTSFDDAKESNEVIQSEAGKLQDYVYDKNYQMYYSLSTGYYYDEKSGLMYDPHTCTYYKYDYEKKEYEKVSQKEDEVIPVHEDKSSNSYICQSVVDQVNNLNLNYHSDESAKPEKLESKVENLEYSAKENENLVDSDDINMKLSENDNISLGCAKDWQPAEGSKLSVSDMVKQVVEEHDNMSDYIYDETYQMYYSSSTGYYFDSVRNLLYDPTTGIYYFYDPDKQTYEFYCQTSPKSVDNDQSLNETANESCINKERLTSRKMYWKKKLKLSKENPTSPVSGQEEGKDDQKLDSSNEEFSSPEDGEIFSSDEDTVDRVCIVRSPIKGLSSKQKSDEELIPPSIRAIVENSENLQIGSLILITCSGGIVGRDKKNAVYLPDICVSKVHANIKYNNDIQTYSIEDLGSQNGTFVNDTRLSEPKLRSEPHNLSHGDKLSLGSCKLLIHIHEGLETCDNCEPGQVLAEISSHIEKNAVMSKEEKEKSRREELQRLKKKYGLKGVNFERKMHLTCIGYEDKAETRRKTVGSDNPYEKTEEASVDRSMPKTNKGYQMLKKMGWKEGQTLGTTDAGLVEPIPLRPWTGKAGLGSSDEPTPCLQQEKRNKKWVKAQERYFQLTLGRDAS